MHYCTRSKLCDETQGIVTNPKNDRHRNNKTNYQHLGNMDLAANIKCVVFPRRSNLPFTVKKWARLAIICNSTMTTQQQVRENNEREFFQSKSGLRVETFNNALPSLEVSSQDTNLDKFRS